MQLVGAILAEYKSIRRVEVPLEGLTVLFGPNGAGKSNVIEALGFHDEVARGSLSRLAGGRPPARARVALIARVDVTADGTGTDSETVLQMLAAPWEAGIPAAEIADGIGAYCGSAWWLDGGSLAEPASRSSLGSALSEIQRAFLADVPAELAEPAQRLLGLLLDQPYLLVQEDFAVNLTCDRGTARGREIAEVAGQLVGLKEGVLSHLLAVLRSWTGRWPPLILMSRGPGAIGGDEDDPLVPAGFGWMSDRLGGVAVVSGDVDTVEDYLDSALEGAHDRMLHRPDPVDGDPDEWSHAFCRRCLHPDHGGRVLPETYDEAPFAFEGTGSWLEEHEAGWSRVRPALLTALTVIEEQTNERLPDFIADQGQVRLVVQPVTQWAEGRARCQVLFEIDPGDEDLGPADWNGPVGVVGSAAPRDRAPRMVALGDLGAGFRRWVATSVRLAADACQSGAVSAVVRRDLDPDGDPDTADSLVATAFDDTPAPRILLIDEPEQHLHPRAQRAVAAWALEQARHHHAVVVATHSPAFFALAPEQASICEVRRIGHETTVNPLRAVHGADAVERARHLGFELGLGHDALAQLTRAVAVVEGEWDRQLLFRYFGRELGDQRILVVPLQGSDELGAMADAAVIPALGVPVIALLDEVRATSHSDLEALTGTLSKAERALRDLAVDLGDNLRIVRYEDPDVICALPEDAVRLAYPTLSFPGWDQLLDDWRAALVAGATDHSFKRWSLKTLGLSRKDRMPSVFFRKVLAQDTGCEPHPRFKAAALQLLSLA